MHQDDDDFRSLSSKLNKEITHVAPTQMPTLGPSTSQSSSSGQPQQRTEETEPRPAQQTDTMAASDRFIHKLDSNEISFKGEVYLAVLREVARNLNKFREDNGLEPLVFKGKERFPLYKVLKEYVDFKNPDGSDYNEKEKTGKGAPLTEIVEQVEATVPFNDVKNDPYFVVK